MSFVGISYVSVSISSHSCLCLVSHLNPLFFLVAVNRLRSWCTSLRTCHWSKRQKKAAPIGLCCTTVLAMTTQGARNSFSSEAGLWKMMACFQDGMLFALCCPSFCVSLHEFPFLPTHFSSFFASIFLSLSFLILGRKWTATCQTPTVEPPWWKRAKLAALG